MKKFLKICLFVFLGFIALVIVLAIALPKSEDTADTTRSEPAPPESTPTPISWISVTAHDILQVYGGNEIAGEQQFAEKPLEVTGSIGRPDYASFSNKKRYSIPIRSDESFAMVSLDCEMPVNEDITAWVSSLVEGSTVTVRGYIRDDMTMGILDLDECTPIRP